ncbi:MAG: ATP-binding protein [Corynebacterium sp.]|uniref:ATP-binding protein n=1 Tax=Corynebacterium sp. TaxID=1720 RepID=UPI0026DBB57E|nr:ATP-binding protein [Corynebacterium sp.]MDO4762519.1 ATP-binding protein [Corynebacterium sp.]
MQAHLRRNIQDWLAELLTTFCAVEISGARQVGKTTLATMMGSVLAKEMAFFSLDDPEVLNAAQNDPRGFLGQADNRIMVIDEFQRAPELVLPLKAAIDADRTPGRFIITGSSQLLAEKSADSLAGRVISCTLRGFSQGELRGYKEDFITRVLSGVDPLEEKTTADRSEYVDIVARGSMPEVQTLSPRMRTAWFDSYLERITSKDIQELRRVPEPHRVLTLLRELAAVQGYEAVIGRLANLANIPATTTSAFVSLLRSVFLIDVIPPWTPNLLKREVGRPKIIMSDSGLGVHLTRTHPDTLKNIIHGQAFGGMLEAFIVSELLRQQTWSETDWSLAHYRSPDDREVDIIVELADQRIIAIEVKAASTVNATDFKHLEWLRDKYSEKFVAGFVMNTDAQGRLLGPKLYSLPVASLWKE